MNAMFDSDPNVYAASEYADIFASRGRDYHKGMTQFPMARAREFETAIKALALQPGESLCDAPAGGGYLRDHLDRRLNTRVMQVDPTDGFIRDTQVIDIADRHMIAPLDSIPLCSRSCDAVVSIAGLHHIDNLVPVFAEFKRLLRPDGRAVILEVDAGSCVGEFLNGFVNANNSLGHRGVFVGDAFRQSLRDGGMTIAMDQLERYTWDFASLTDMATFTRLIFGLDKASDDQIIEGIDDILGIEQHAGGCAMNWELRLITAV